MATNSLSPSTATCNTNNSIDVHNKEPNDVVITGIGLETDKTNTLDTLNTLMPDQPATKATRKKKSKSKQKAKPQKG
jgi:hypothetical protein